MLWHKCENENSVYKLRIKLRQRNLRAGRNIKCFLNLDIWIARMAHTSGKIQKHMYYKGQISEIDNKLGFL